MSGYAVLRRPSRSRASGVRIARMTCWRCASASCCCSACASSASLRRRIASSSWSSIDIGGDPAEGASRGPLVVFPELGPRGRELFHEVVGRVVEERLALRRDDLPPVLRLVGDQAGG